MVLHPSRVIVVAVWLTKIRNHLRLDLQGQARKKCDMDVDNKHASYLISRFTWTDGNRLAKKET